MRTDRLGSFAGGTAQRDHRMAQEAGDPADSPALHEVDTEFVVDHHREDAQVEVEVFGGIRGPGDLQEGIRAAAGSEGGRVRAEVADMVLEEARIQDLVVGDMVKVNIPGEGRSWGRGVLERRIVRIFRSRRRGDFKFVWSAGVGTYGLGDIDCMTWCRSGLSER